MKTRSSLLLYVNGVRTEVAGDDAFLPLANFLRKNRGLTGTKIVCAEGDCGACSVLVAFPEREDSFKMINSCIAPVFLMDGASIISVEGLCHEDGGLSLIQHAMVENHASQCGFCTPGFVVALSNLVEDRKLSALTKIDGASVKNYCTGNLCRCTGYESIIQAGMAMDPVAWKPLVKRYLTKEMATDLRRAAQVPLIIESGDKLCLAPTTAKDVSKILKAEKNLRIVSSATDLGVIHNKEKIDLYRVITLHHVPELYAVKESAKEMRIGAKVSLERLRLATKKSFPEFSKFLNIFASLQIRNFATLVGNIANASPIGDTLPFLFIADAQLEIMGSAKRVVPITKFYQGYRKMDLRPGEWISAVTIPKLPAKSSVRLYKISQRRDLDISTVSAAFLRQGESVRAAYGGVGPTTMRLYGFEKFLAGKKLDESTVKAARAQLKKEIAPLSDARASREFRLLVSENLFRKFVHEEGGA